MRHKDFYLQNFQPKIDEVNESIENDKYRKLKKTFAINGPVIEEDYE
jgi:hypothetical protein